MPKEMLPVVDKPLIQYAFEEAVNSGIEKFIFITGRNKNIISNHFDHVYEDGNSVGVQQINKANTASYGIIEPDSEEVNNVIKLKSVVEKPKPKNAPSDKAIVGRYILTPEIFSVLENQATGAGGEIQLTDAIEKMIASGTKSDAVILDSLRFDCGNRRGFLEANIVFALKNPELEQHTKDIVAKWFS